MPRIELVPTDPAILSSYPFNGERPALRRLCDFPDGQMTPDAAVALFALHRAVTDAGGDFRVTSGYRSVATQRKLRARYDAWVAVGKPAPMVGGRPNPDFDAKTMKAAFVAVPGYSFHNAGRAVDIDLGSIRFPGVVANKQLDRLWELAKPLGWAAVIAKPTEGASESWHFDYLGPWAGLLARRGDYAEAAMAACLDIGGAGYKHDAEREIQAQLHRTGYDVGAIDGFIGAKTRAAVRAAGYASDTPLPTLLAEFRTLPDAR